MILYFSKKIHKNRFSFCTSLFEIDGFWKNQANTCFSKPIFSKISSFDLSRATSNSDFLKTLRFVYEKKANLHSISKQAPKIQFFREFSVDPMVTKCVNIGTRRIFLVCILKLVRTNVPLTTNNTHQKNSLPVFFFFFISRI